MNEPSLTIFLSGTNEPPIHGNTMSNNVLHRAGGNEVTGPDEPPRLHKFFHNAYGMEMARVTYEGLKRLRPDRCPFVLTRPGTAGIQRYTALWTGDNSSRWEHISMTMSMCLNIGMSGIPFESACRIAIEQHNRLMPYLYTLFREAAPSGAPIMRPLYYHYPQDEHACDTESEFLVGDSLLSAPISDEGATSRSVYLPAGIW